MSATADSPPKKTKTTQTIGTHDGIFHCDEILACFMLQQLPEFAGAAVLRTRDESRLRDCEIVVDVGAVYNPSALRYDHHQSTFNETLSTVRPELGDQYRIRLSSAGLVYAHYGEAVIERILSEKCPKLNKLTAAELRNIYVKLYMGFVQEIDGIDNGVPMFDGEPAYRVSTDLSSRVATFNVPWNAPDGAAAFDAQSQFEKAQQMVGAEFVDRVVYLASSWWPARRIVEEAVRGRFEVHESGAILELSQFAPWKEHLFELESEQKELAGVPIYVLSENRPGDFRVIGVPLNPKSFVGRKFLAKSWRGLRGADLEAASGVVGANFIHASGFIGGAATREAALQMAIKSLESVDE